jgi:hypothetical protein
LSTRLEDVLSSLHENQLAIRRQLMSLMAGQQALMDQLNEKDLLDMQRWERDKVRHQQQFEQIVAARDDEQREAKARGRASEAPVVGVATGTGMMRFNLAEAPVEQIGAEIEYCSHPKLSSDNPRRDVCPDCGYEFYYGDVHATEAEARKNHVVNPGRDKDAHERKKQEP